MDEYGAADEIYAFAEFRRPSFLDFRRNSGT